MATRYVPEEFATIQAAFAAAASGDTIVVSPVYSVPAYQLPVTTREVMSVYVPPRVTGVEIVHAYDWGGTFNLIGDGNVRLYAGKGNDTLISGAGSDTMWGGAGNDWMVGGDGDDELNGESGNDTLAGGRGNDRLYGSSFSVDTATYAQFGLQGVVVALGTYKAIDNWGGTDTLESIENIIGSSLNDSLTGGSGVNVLSGNMGNDTLNGGYSGDTLDGGLGDDVLGGGHGKDSLVGGDGIDTASYLDNAGYQGATVDLLTGMVVDNFGYADTLVGIENLIGSALGDSLTGDDGANSLMGNGGNDTLAGGRGDDTLAGGDGTDTASYAGAGSGVTVRLSLAAAQNTGGTGFDTLSGIENLTGSAFADNLTGDGGANALFGGAGTVTDTLNGAGGDDTLDGGLGGDAMVGGLGNDVYIVDSAGDVVTEALNEGTDTVRASRNYQLTDNVEGLIYTGSENFTGTGNALANTITGGVGNDTLEGGLGNDTLNGGGGSDTASYAKSTAGIKVSLSLAGAQNTAGAGSDTLTGFENLSGSDFSDQLTGDGNANVLTGGKGIDILAGLDGDDTLVGGDGSDTASYEAAISAVWVSLVAGSQDTYGAGRDTLVLIENLTGSALNDRLTGSDGANTLLGGSGSDTLHGGGGNDNLVGGAGHDTLDGGAGSDKMDGGLGNDTFYVGSGDIVVEKAGEGTDTVITTTAAYKLGAAVENLTYAGAGKFSGTGNALDNVIRGGNDDDTIEGGAGNDTLWGYWGINTASYGQSTAGVTVSLLIGGAQNTVGAGVDRLNDFQNLTGSAYADTLTGDGGANVLLGGAGNDTLDGRAGADTMTGAGGNDSYVVDNAGDKVIEKGGQGTDTVSTTLSAYVLDATLENLTFIGLGAFTGTGNALANTLTGGAGSDVLNGGKAADTLIGGSGIDTASYATSKAAVKASLATPGTNTGEAAGDSYSSIEGLLGSKYADTLAGDSGDNRLNGGGGLDKLAGGSGSDTFVFNLSLVAGNVATVADFTAGTDRFELSLSVFTAAGGAGTLKAAAFHLGATAGDATDRILYDGATGKLFYDADGTGATAAKAFATLSPGLALTENSFQLV